MVGEISRPYVAGENAWLFYARSFPTYFSHHYDANMKAGRFWDRWFVKEESEEEDLEEEDEDSEKAVIWQSRTRMSEVTRVAIASWQPCVDFSAETGGDTAGGSIPSESCRPVYIDRHEYLCS